MLRGFAMNSQDKRICKDESSVDYNNNRVYEEDYFNDILNVFDFPMESLEGDGLAEDWASKLGPIPSEVFRELLPAVSGGGSSANLSSDYILKPNISGEQNPNPFNSPSPKSVLETRTTSSNNKPISFISENTIPVKARTKRARPTTNPWLTIIPNNNNKKNNPAHVPINIETKRLNASGIKKCTHCEITKTPQWREGPMGPTTLCNACGVRYRSGRLYPEYRPAASPTFVPSLHSNSHRKVIEMRQKGVIERTKWF